MIILRKYKIIYIDMPKTMSTSLKYFCADLLYPDRDRTISVHTVKFPKVPKNEIKLYNDYFKFCFVRNPWGKLVSLYFDKIQNKSSENNTFFTIRPGVANCLAKFMCFKAGMSFESFVRAVNNVSDQEASKHFQSQHKLITDSADNLIVDFIGRFENLKEDFAKVIKRAGIPSATLHHLNKNNNIGKKDFRSYYNEETKRIVAERYKVDIETFGYSF